MEFFLRFQTLKVARRESPACKSDEGYIKNLNFFLVPMLLWFVFLLATVSQCTIFWFVGFNMGGSSSGFGLFILGILTIEYIIVFLLIVFGAAIDFLTHWRPNYD